MRPSWILLAALVLSSVPSLVVGGGPAAIVERWTPADPTPATFRKVAVIGIAADSEIRHRFENKLVSHLRGRGLMAVASYTLVPDLAAPGDPEKILDIVLAEGIDGAITIRALPVASKDEETWAATWRDEWTALGTLRPFVAESLPVSGAKADRYGLDFAVWHGSPFRSVWSGRTEVYPASQLRKHAGDVVQSVIDAFEDAKLF